MPLNPSLFPVYRRITLALDLRRAIGIRAEGKRLPEKHAIAPSAGSAYAGSTQKILFNLEAI